MTATKKTKSKVSVKKPTSKKQTEPAINEKVAKNQNNKVDEKVEEPKVETHHVETVKNALTKTSKTVYEFIKELGVKGFGFVKKMITGLWDGIKYIGSTIKGFFTKAKNGITRQNGEILSRSISATALEGGLLVAAAAAIYFSIATIGLVYTLVALFGAYILGEIVAFGLQPKEERDAQLANLKESVLPKKEAAQAA